LRRSYGLVRLRLPAPTRLRRTAQRRVGTTAQPAV